MQLAGSPASSPALLAEEPSSPAVRVDSAAAAAAAAGWKVQEALAGWAVAVAGWAVAVAGWGVVVPG